MLERLALALAFACGDIPLSASLHNFDGYVPRRISCRCFTSFAALSVHFNPFNSPAPFHPASTYTQTSSHQSCLPTNLPTNTRSKTARCNICYGNGQYDRACIPCAGSGSLVRTIPAGNAQNPGPQNLRSRDLKLRNTKGRDTRPQYANEDTNEEQYLEECSECSGTGMVTYTCNYCDGGHQDGATVGECGY
ncbi:hypothetical protein EJ06DRAFT_89651 [Trichodelitschia bisporula]|uniref:Uncharacterized protein n=1 Tax=Trichodelitschia bisporula TaxID=703511 RepID=A0A6G1HSL0_9PEZI|nr:hypothetical protein EJ06DRAFT_89651 [Trichodelitschia bisporula]